jgi:DNA-binding transcriptional LysR family regulator
MNIEQLYTFQEVARLGSFSEVAKKLGISQPAVSFQIQKLEQELGIRLIDRSQRALALTAAGRRLLEFAETVEIERERLQRDLEQMRDEVAGDLRLSASTIPGEYLLPPLLARFKQRYPAVRIQVDVSDSLTVIDRIGSNAAAIGFCGIVPEGKDLDFFAIAADEIVLIVPPQHPLAARGEITPDELAGEPFIFREPTSGTQRSLQSLLARTGIDTGKWTPQLVLGSTQAVILAVAAGAGVAFVSDVAVKKCPGGVRQVEVRGLRLKRDFYCIYRQERLVSRLHREFIDFVRTEAAHDVRTEP